MSAALVISVSMTDETPDADHFHKLMLVPASANAAARLVVNPVKPLAYPIVAAICCPDELKDVKGNPPIVIAPADVPSAEMLTIPVM